MAATSSANFTKNEYVSDHVEANTMINNQFARAGIITRDKNFDKIIQQEGDTYTERFVSYEHVPSQRMNENMASLMKWNGFAGQKLQGRKHYRSNGWAETNLTKIRAGFSTQEEFMAYLVDYWDVEVPRLGLSSTKGIIASIKANPQASEFVHTETGTTENPVRGQARAFARAVHKLGDRRRIIKSFVIHSDVELALIENKFIFYEEERNKDLDLDTFLRKNVVVCDDLPIATPPDAPPIYTSLAFGQSFFRFSINSEASGMWESGNNAGGRGSGHKATATKLVFGLHPVGFEYNPNVVPEATTADEAVAFDSEGDPINEDEITLSDAQLEAAATWRRVYDPKAIPFRILETN